jgi:hypothetical protein
MLSQFAALVDQIADAAVVMAKPAATVNLAPTRSAMRSAGTAPRTNPRITGNSRTPASCGSIPGTPCEYCGAALR